VISGQHYQYRFRVLSLRMDGSKTNGRSSVLRQRFGEDMHFVFIETEKRSEL